MFANFQGEGQVEPFGHAKGRGEVSRQEAIGRNLQLPRINIRPIHAQDIGDATVAED